MLAVGPLAARLQEALDGVEVRELEAAADWAGERLVVAVEEVSTGCPPGTVHRVDATAHELPADVFGGSAVGEAVATARAKGRLPARLVVYGVEGEPAATRVAGLIREDLARLV